MSTAQKVDEHDVIISGLGPTGLTLAHLLGQRGLDVLVLEREPAFYGNARAVYTDDECMRIFQSLGVADALQADMVTDCPVQMVLPNGSVLLQIIDTKRPYGWSPSNFFYQPKLETRLEELLGRYSNVRVQRGRDVLGFEQDLRGVSVLHESTQVTGYGRQTPAPAAVRGASRSNEVTRCKYFVGCDGGRSTVRAQLGIEMTGQSFPNPWLVVDIRQKDKSSGLRHLPYFNFICDPACPTVSCVQPDGHHRFEFMLMPGQTREYMEDPATIRQHLARHIDVDQFEVLRSLVYTFNALIAERWRTGRVFLAGDAAHMTPQFIGQGMNAGVRDAYNLGWKLDAVLRGRAGDALLDSYQSERRPHVNAMIRTAVQMKNFVSTAHPIKAALRNGLTKLALATPGLGRFVREGSFIPQPFYEPGTYVGLPRTRRSAAAGKLPPQPRVRAGSGQCCLLDEVLGNDFALVGLGVDPRDGLSDSQLALWERLGTRYVAVYPLGGRPQGKVARTWRAGLAEIEDLHREFIDWMGSRGHRMGSVAILRPDRFVFGVVPAAELAAAMQLLWRQMDCRDVGAVASPTSHVGARASLKEAA